MLTRYCLERGLFFQGSRLLFAGFEYIPAPACPVGRGTRKP